MKTVGIVAEYNPFHSGHEYQIAYAKNTLGADCCVVVMSGPFTQRGLPAIFDKYTRAESAIKCGADLVIELPVVYATASAETFAEGAIKTLQATGVVDTVLFGCESPDIKKIEKAADILLQEPDSYVHNLKNALATGASFPKARASALSAEGIRDIVDSPNNILSVEYVKALKKYHCSMIPAAMQRTGADYHDLHLDGTYASASAIRENIFTSTNLEFLSKVPLCLKNTYTHLMDCKYFLAPDDFSLPLMYSLLTHNTYECFSDCSRELSNKILHNSTRYESFLAFSDILKTKELSHTRITRVLNHIMLQIERDFFQECKVLTSAPYLRILGIRRSKEHLLGEIKKRGYAPMVTSPKAALEQLQSIDLEILQKDLFAAELYRNVLSCKSHQSLPNEFTRKFSPIS